MRRIEIGHSRLDDLTGEILSRGGRIAFEARGSSMSPHISEGDLLTVEATSPGAVAIGDVLVYRIRDGRLGIHRVVKSEEKANGRRLFTVRGDAVAVGLPIDEDRIIGRVAHVRRSLKVKMAPVRCALRRAVIRLVLRCQGLKWYRMLGRTVVRRTVRCRPAACRDRAGIGNLYAGELPGNWENDEDTNGGGPSLAVASFGRSIAGAVLVGSSPRGGMTPSECWLAGMKVRFRFRGLGIGECLLRCALEMAAGKGAERVRVSVFRDNRPALRLYRRLGFTEAPVVSGETALQPHGAAGAPAPIVMWKFLHHDPGKKIL